MPILTNAERIGSTLAGKYELHKLVGEGGMGAVFEAVHAWTQRPVAIKILQPRYADDHEMGERFLREARVAARLRHPNVVDVLDMGQDEDGTVFIALELLDGESLASILKRRSGLPLDEMARILLPIMDAVVLAHKKGFVHRDIKPDNIFVSRDAAGAIVPKLLDFGIAKAMLAQEEMITHSGAVMGTVHYMSPEQAQGKAVGPAADVWAMGVILYQCASGALPFAGDSTTDVLMKIVAGVAPPLGGLRPELPRELVTVIERAMAYSQELRIRDMATLCETVRAICRGAPALNPGAEGAPVTAPAVQVGAQHVPTLSTIGRDAGGALERTLVTDPPSFEESPTFEDAPTFDEGDAVGTTVLGSAATLVADARPGPMGSTPTLAASPAPRDAVPGPSARRPSRRTLAVVVGVLAMVAVVAIVRSAQQGEDETQLPELPTVSQDPSLQELPLRAPERDDGTPDGAVTTAGTAAPDPTEADTGDQGETAATSPIDTAPTQTSTAESGVSLRRRPRPRPERPRTPGPPDSRSAAPAGDGLPPIVRDFE